MSEGMRSGVHWMRWKSAPIERAKARAAIVLPVPGTSSSSTCPRASSATSSSWSGSSAPTMTCATFSRA